MPDKMDISLDEMIQRGTSSITRPPMFGRLTPYPTYAERRAKASSIDKGLRSKTPLGARGAIGKVRISGKK